MCCNRLRVHSKRLRFRLAFLTRQWHAHPDSAARGGARGPQRGDQRSPGAPQHPRARGNPRPERAEDARSAHIARSGLPGWVGVEVGLGVIAHLDRQLVDTIEGVDATDGYGAVHQVLRSGVREVEDEIRTEVERLYGVARESVRAVWPSVRAVAEALLEREELNRATLDDVLGDADIFTPVFAVQQAHGLLARLETARSA
jgi:hypothetical protein